MSGSSGCRPKTCMCSAGSRDVCGDDAASSVADVEVAGEAGTDNENGWSTGPGDFSRSAIISRRRVQKGATTDHQKEKQKNIYSIIVYII
jgi:hypothetical protein